MCVGETVKRVPVPISSAAASIAAGRALQATKADAVGMWSPCVLE